MCDSYINLQSFIANEGRRRSHVYCWPHVVLTHSLDHLCDESSESGLEWKDVEDKLTEAFTWAGED